MEYAHEPVRDFIRANDDYQIACDLAGLDQTAFLRLLGFVRTWFHDPSLRKDQLTLKSRSIVILTNAPHHLVPTVDASRQFNPAVPQQTDLADPSPFELTVFVALWTPKPSRAPLYLLFLH